MKTSRKFRTLFYLYIVSIFFMIIFALLYNYFSLQNGENKELAVVSVTKHEYPKYTLKLNIDLTYDVDSLPFWLNEQIYRKILLVCFWTIGLIGVFHLFIAYLSWKVINEDEKLLKEFMNEYPTVAEYMAGKDIRKELKVNTPETIFLDAFEAQKNAEKANCADETVSKNENR